MRNILNSTFAKFLTIIVLVLCSSASCNKNDDYDDISMQINGIRYVRYKAPVKLASSKLSRYFNGYVLETPVFM